MTTYTVRKHLCWSIPYIATLLLAVANAANAATLTPNGVVLINRGNGFEVVSQQINVLPTDRVMISSGSAQITYDDGSIANLQQGYVYSVGSPNLPPSGSQPQSQVITGQIQGQGPGQGAPPAGQGPPQGGEGPPQGAAEGPPQGQPVGQGGVPTYALIGGAVAIAGAAVLVSSITKDATKPAQPSSP